MAIMTHNEVDEVMEYIDRFAEDWPAGTSKAIFYFLYKEILINRIAILEADPAKNRGAIEYNEKIINNLNGGLMNQLKTKKP